MARLLIFNPEHDYALANGTPYYIAPKSVKRLSVQLQVLPLIWAQDGDLILLTDDSLIQAGNPRILNRQDVMPKICSLNISEVEPWGWDMQIRHRLLKVGIDPPLLFSKENIATLRKLSHRRISIPANEYLLSPSVPQEIFSIDEAMQFVSRNPGCYFKLPWSSGGRGVLATKELDDRQIKEWVTGALRRQKSILAERGIDRALDFASLWSLSDSKAEFIGMSISKSDGRGKYGGNLYGSQEKIIEYIRSKAPSFSMDIISLQATFLNEYIAPKYSGKLGIDMIAGKDGAIYPCIEINLRKTMGHVAMEYQKFISLNKKWILTTPLPLHPL